MTLNYDLNRLKAYEYLIYKVNFEIPLQIFDMSYVMFIAMLSADGDM